MNPRIRRSFAVAWQDKEYRWSLRKANRPLRKAALLGAMIVVVLGLEMKWAEAAGPPYPSGYCKDVTLGGSPFPATAECAVDTNSGTVGDMAYSDGVGAAGARAEEGTTGNFSYSGYYTITCDIKYVAKFSKSWLAFATLHANLFVDGVKYTDNLGADGVWPWEMPSMSQLWSAPRNRSWHITRTLYLGRGSHTFSCGLEDRVSTGGYTIDFYAAMVGVGDVTRINW